MAASNGMSKFDVMDTFTTNVNIPEKIISPT